jgi:hypothetical protein
VGTFWIFGYFRVKRPILVKSDQGILSNFEGNFSHLLALVRGLQVVIEKQSIFSLKSLVAARFSKKGENRGF